MPRALLIQDGDAVRRRTQELLEAGGLSVEATASGLDGLARALRSPPQLIVADVHLPDLPGPELAARLRQEPALSGVPLVCVGGSDEDRALALAAGADAVVDAAGDLPARVREVLGGARQALPPERELAALRGLVGGLSIRLEEALAAQRRTLDKLVESSRLKSAFMHNLAHELSTPLTPLAGYLRILQSEKTGPLAPQQKRILESMSGAVSRLSRILDNLADFASLQAGHAPLVETALQPDALADEVAAEQRGPVKDARIHLVVAHAGGPVVLADSRKLRQALFNLVSNAVKFSPHGGEVLLEVTQEPARLRYTVYDQGPGVPVVEQERIFEPLHHAAARDGQEARAPGSGLGLPVARRIAEAHGGQVWVESPPRTQPRSDSHQFNGAKFVLEVPVRSAQGAAAGPGPAPDAVAGSR